MAAQLLLAFTALTAVRAQSYTTTFTPGDLPNQWQDGQYGTDNCGTGSSQTSLCQVAYMNSIEDFCLWAPPYSDGTNATIGETERYEVSWCMKSGYGTRLIPDGTIIGAHWVQTPDYVQITGNGDFTKLGIPATDAGGELDPHGADGNGNPIGGIVFGNSFGTLQQYHEWTSFMSNSEFCFRACKDGPNAPALCNHIYDTMGCEWNMPANYANGVFESCLGDSGTPMGVYGTSTWFQGVSPTPAAGDTPSSSECTTLPTITQINSGTPTATVVSSSAAKATVTPNALPAASTSAKATSTAAAHSAASRHQAWDAVFFALACGVVGVLVGGAAAL